MIIILRGDRKLTPLFVSSLAATEGMLQALADVLARVRQLPQSNTCPWAYSS